jgi:glutaminyl-peptide cyclotransferase
MAKIKRVLPALVALLGLLLLAVGLYQLARPAATVIPTNTPSPSPSPPPARSPSPTPTAAPRRFDGRSAYDYVLAQTGLGPRPSGSKANLATGDLILKELARWGWETETQEFIFKGTPVRNVIGRKGSGPVVIVGAHYDTRPYADEDPANKNQWISGANDGASGVAVLLELARTLDAGALQNEVWLAFFDAEDRGHLDDWPWSVGARYVAENLAVKPQAMVLLDMVGDADQQFYYEHNSDPGLQVEIWELAARLGYGEQFIAEYKWTLIDDHIPFVERGISALDIIDFDYPYWHTGQDTADKVSAESLERIGRVMETWLESQ